MNIRRRPLLASGILLSAHLRLHAQTLEKVWHIGVLQHNLRWEGALAYSLNVPLKALGYEEGRNLQFDLRTTQGQQHRLEGLAAELVAAKVGLIIAPLNDEVRAVIRATRTIPELMMFGSAPMEMGLITLLARPGGNVTVTTTTVPESASKFIEVLREAIPGMRRLAAMFEPDYPGMALYQQEMDRAGNSMNIKIHFLPVRATADVDMAFQAMDRDRPDAIFLAMTGPMQPNGQRIIEFAARQRLPAIYSIPWPVRTGGSMSYSPNFTAMAKRNAAMIDRIFRGSKPADIPVEEPAQFQLPINLKTAKALGIAIPQTLLLRADEVIQ